MPSDSENSHDGSEVEPEIEDNDDFADGVSFALIHEATSLTNFDALSDPESIESQVSRSRGKGYVKKQVPSDPDNQSDDEGKQYEVTVEEGRLKTDSGYVIRFVDGNHLDLSPFDVMSLETIRAYPAPEALIESLTPRIRGHLKEHGYVQIRGAYSPSNSEFYGVQMGWDTSDEVDPWDRLMEVIEQVSTTPAALDYVFVEEGPDRWDEEELARVRGVKMSSVSANVRAIENELDE